MKTLVKLMMVLAFGLAAYSALTGKAGAHEVYDSPPAARPGVFHWD